MSPLNNIILDRLYLRSLEQLAIREGFVSKQHDGSPLWMNDVLEARNTLKSRTLLLLTLFETIDSDYTGLDFSFFVDQGLVAPGATLINHDAAERSLKALYPCNTTATEDMQTALAIARRFRQRIFDYIYRTYHEDLVGFKRYGRTNVRYVNWYVPSRHVPRSKLCAFVDEALEIIENKNKGDTVGEFCSVQAYNTYKHLASIVFNLRDCLFLSKARNAPFACAFPDAGVSGAPCSPELIDDLYYLVRTNLTDELLVLPAPRSLAEALRLRNDKGMIRFREVLAHWLDALQRGDAIAVETIRRDLRKVNRSLTTLQTWRRYEQSPINFWLNSIGGHVPILSNILAVVHMLGGMYAHKAADRNSWMMLVQGRSASRSSKRIKLPAT